MNLTIDKDSRTPFYLQISGGIGRMIRTGELPTGYKLPSERQLAHELGVHRNTIVKAYLELIADGLIIASRQHPRGYFVGDKTVGTQKCFPLEQSIRYDFDRAVQEMMTLYFHSDDPAIMSLAGLTIGHKLEYVPELDMATRRIFDPEDGGNLSRYQSEVNRLRTNIEKMLEKRNLYVPAKNIQIVTEDYSAMSHLIDLYTMPGDCILAEEPMSPEFAGLVANKGVQILTVPMENDGVDLSKLERMVRKHRPRFFYTMPCYHNPTGITMSIEKREALLLLAEKYELMIIEHDWLRWLRQDVTNPPTLYMMDRGRSVVYIDSFALLFPYGIQIGYLLGPEETVSMMGRVTTISEKVPGNISFYYLNEYLESGQFHKHIKSLAEDCAKRYQMVNEAFQSLRPYGFCWNEAGGGMHLWCKLPETANADAFYRYLSDHNVQVVPGRLFYRSKRNGAEYFRICFTNVTEADLRRGIEWIREALLRAVTSESSEPYSDI